MTCTVPGQTTPHLLEVDFRRACTYLPPASLIMRVPIAVGWTTLPPALNVELDLVGTRIELPVCYRKVCYFSLYCGSPTAQNYAIGPGTTV